MDPLAMVKAEPPDILFENRNKRYGDYPPRKYYTQRLIISLDNTIVLVLLSILGNGTAGREAPNSGTDSASVSKPGIYANAAIMPSFPGAPATLQHFLLKNLHMPENNLDPGTQVYVMARFIVGADGRVRGIEITDALENMFSAEVKRVILKMPDWNPGVQNHRNVAAYYNLPVNFVTAE